MTTQTWERVKELLHRAMQLDPEERVLFLDEACASDAALRAEVESLLFADEDIRSSFLRSTPLETGKGRDDALAAVEAGQIFAERFQTVRKLGEGGMGQIWLAEQTSPVRRQVALKLIKAGMYDQAVVQRFLAERQSLAIMDHPAIAKVFDAGTTPQGQPYLVMEYVPGLPITDYCDQKTLKISDRLELFIQVCEGVQHAHQKAIIHRDLKPANILIAEVDGKPVPRIIDFGLAKATTPRLDEETFTQLGHFMGTPGYMSPEQADPKGRDGVQDIDTRTDVYSLGVILYVLLAGLLPFETKRREKPPLDELLRKLREEDPPSPSNKVSTDRDSSSATAEARGTEPKQLVSLLRGDLDWITMKAVEKDRARRYGAPSELAADIRRYLNHEPVVARSASVGYRLRKYIRRHRLAVSIAAGLVLLLAGFSVLQGLQLRRITRERDRANQERDRANRERDRATRITDFMAGMFKVPDPNQAHGNTVTAREILDKASKDMEAGLAKDPEIQSQMMQVMANTYINLGLLGRAHELAKQALDARRNLLGPDDPKTLESMAQLGWILEREGQYAEAEKLERQALAGERRVLGTEDALTLVTMDHVAVILQVQGRNTEAEKLEREVIEVGTRKLGPESDPTLRGMNNLGLVLLDQARFAEGEQEFRQLLNIGRRIWGPENPRTLTTMGNLALAVFLQGRLAEAESLYRENMSALQRVLGPEHPNTTIDMDSLADVLNMEGHLAEAEKLLRETVKIRRRTLGPEHLDTLRSESNLAEVLVKEGLVREAEKMQRETLATQLRVFGPENPLTFLAQTNLAEILNKEGRYPEAEKIARETLDATMKELGLQHPYTQNSYQQLGMALALSHRYAEATKLFHDLIEKQGDSAGKGNRWSVWYSFACVAATANHPDDAVQYLHEAINHGYKDADALIADPDLEKLRPNSNFQQLVAALKTAAQKNSAQ